MNYRKIILFVVFLIAFAGHLFYFKIIEVHNSSNWWSSYVKMQLYFTSFSLGLAFSYGAFAIINVRRFKTGAKGATMGSIVLAFFIWFTSCCGAPLLVALLSIFGIGVGSVVFPTWAVALLTIVLVSIGYLWMKKKITTNKIIKIMETKENTIKESKPCCEGDVKVKTEEIKKTAEETCCGCETQIQDKTDIKKLGNDEIKEIVKERYGKCAEKGGGEESSCCSSEVPASKSFAAEQGLYGQDELSLVPEIALNLSKGCGNPTGFANIQAGEVVVDLGCGAGIDVVLSANKASATGKVFGVDLAPQMIERAKQAVAEAGLTDRVELVVGDLEQIELPDGFADVIISNCVINLCPDKDAVYNEAYRILKPGGRLAISDIILKENIDAQVQERFQSIWAGCTGGAMAECCYFELIEKAGFKQVDVKYRHQLSDKELDDMARCPGAEYTPAPAKEDIAQIQGKVVSIKFTAIKA